ncbi:PAS domain-containing sensor histidine kinase [Nonlabens ponticola]|uniref:histidine kinase n=1 Tax=Nonlabens ponticola TaxID=2496866 RepID=A0A3S9MW30_9FLAO|nr:PAS domain-containing sensor histidine kinase [Nonlabens ponticola]AZQ43337.1 PAS domain S-box protein [Nonlabens ponticola]
MKEIPHQSFKALHEQLYQAPVAIAYLDNDLKYLAHSLKWCSDYNLDKTDLRGFQHYEIFPEIGKEWRDKHQRILNGAEEHSDGQSFLREDGTTQWIKWSIKPHRSNGEIAGVIMYSEDITDFVEEQARHNKEHQLLLDAADKAKIGSWEVNHINGELYWSDTTKKIHEVAVDFVPDVATGLSFYKPGASQEKVTDLFTRSYTTGEEFDVELQLITAKGNERWVRSVMKAEMVDGKCVRQFGTFEDITEKVYVDRAYGAALRKFEELFNASGVGMLVVDPVSLQIGAVNPSISSLLNYDADMLMRMSLEQMVSKDEFPRLFNAVTDLLNKKVNNLELEIKLKRSTGKFVASSIVGTLIEDENGDPIDLIIQALDISALKDKEQELKAFTKFTAQQNERLLNFAHIVSHNLRSHSSNFEVLLHLYQKEENEDDKNNIIQLLSSSSKQLTETIGHLNDVVAVNTERIELSNIYLKDNIVKVMDNISSQIKENQVDVHINIDDDFVVSASPAYLESILLNLMTNSIKYRKKDIASFIKISATKQDGKSLIVFEDNGTGIDMKRNGHKVFGMYKTFHGNKDARGIGLYMTKNQVEAMGGTIGVRSKKNLGTTFRITL